MAHARIPAPVRFFTGVLASSPTSLPRVRAALEEAFGPIDSQSEVFDFSNTAYYREEAGDAIVRTFYGFATPIQPDELAGRKVRTNRMEEELAQELDLPYPRPINLDPGYLEPSKVILASAKNFAHRIYLSEGIYAEVTLLFRHGGIDTLEWTFPDYATGQYHPFFNAQRSKLMELLQTK